MAGIRCWTSCQTRCWRTILLTHETLWRASCLLLTPWVSNIERLVPLWQGVCLKCGVSSAVFSREEAIYYSYACVMSWKYINVNWGVVYHKSDLKRGILYFCAPFEGPPFKTDYYLQISHEHLAVPHPANPTFIRSHSFWKVTFEGHFTFLLLEECA